MPSLFQDGFVKKNSFNNNLITLKLGPFNRPKHYTWRVKKGDLLFCLDHLNASEFSDEQNCTKTIEGYVSS